MQSNENVWSWKSHLRGSEAYVSKGNKGSGMSEVNVGLRQGCVMPPWLLNLHMDALIKDVNARAMGRGVNLEQNSQEEMMNQL